MLVLDILFRLAAIGIFIAGLWFIVSGMKDMGHVIDRYLGQPQAEKQRRVPARQNNGSYQQQQVPAPSKSGQPPPRN